MENFNLKSSFSQLILFYIKKIIKLFFIIMICLLFSGCYMLSPSSSRWLIYSDEQPFERLRGQTVTLKRPIHVFSVVDLNKAPNDSASVFPQNMDTLPDKIPAGSKIILHSFHLNTNYILIWIPVKTRYEVWFDVPGCPLPNENHFIYIWGKDKYLHRAPWEAEGVPERRYVGLDGKGYKEDN
jgi:hypothetical protein